MTRICSDCPSTISKESTTGRCRSCALARLNKSRKIYARQGVPPANKAETPGDFSVVAPQITMKEARVRFGRSAETIRRWCAETGVRLKPSNHLVAGSSTRKFSPVAPRAHVEIGEAGQAAEFLRRFGPVFRCDVDGRQLQDGFFWNRGGRTVLTDEELIERARRNGWDPDAWRRIAA
jgi:hypothetical protein